MKTSFTEAIDEGRILAIRKALVKKAGALVGAADAEDIAHEALERALRTLARSDRDPAPWLHQVTRNLAYDALRARARAPMLVPSETPAESAERTVLRQEAAVELGDALQTLPSEHRRTIVLHDLEGYTNHEIASLDGVNFHTVKTRLFRARRALRDRLLPEVA